MVHATNLNNGDLAIERVFTLPLDLSSSVLEVDIGMETLYSQPNRLGLLVRLVSGTAGFPATNYVEWIYTNLVDFNDGSWYAKFVADTSVNDVEGGTFDPTNVVAIQIEWGKLTGGGPGISIADRSRTLGPGAAYCRIAASLPHLAGETPGSRYDCCYRSRCGGRRCRSLFERGKTDRGFEISGGRRL